MKRKPLDTVLGLHRAVHRLCLLIAGLPRIRITQAEAFVLAHLHNRKNATMLELHRAFGHKRSTLTAVIDRLVERGLASREISANDRRSFVIGLSPSGEALARGVHKALSSIEQTAFRGMSEAEIASFGRILERFCRA